MKLSTLHWILLSISVISACDIVERNALLKEGYHTYLIVHSIEDTLNESLQLASLLKFLKFKDLKRNVPFLLDPVLFQGMRNVFPKIKTDICGSSDVRNYSRFLLKHDSVTGVAYGCHYRYRSMYKILIVSEENWANSQFFDRQFERISASFVFQACNCDKIVDDFTKKCLAIQNEDVLPKFGLLVLLIILALLVAYFVLKGLFNNAVADKQFE